LKTIFSFQAACIKRMSYLNLTVHSATNRDLNKTAGMKN